MATFGVGFLIVASIFLIAIAMFLIAACLKCYQNAKVGRKSGYVAIV